MESDSDQEADDNAAASDDEADDDWYEVESAVGAHHKKSKTSQGPLEGLRLRK